MRRAILFCETMRFYKQEDTVVFNGVLIKLQGFRMRLIGVIEAIKEENRL